MKRRKPRGRAEAEEGGVEEGGCGLGGRPEAAEERREEAMGARRRPPTTTRVHARRSICYVVNSFRCVEKIIKKSM
ncbi:Os11g0546401 [Oryza sativa Japonica Group]|uniref:Os11g0546401 protein n=1 Tax=Oryza sativa subsp. japonica TaxID=39947 RepID=A0A0P0Y3I5_ORYSJ|nr:hypothetical protein EE612_056035 [Oryza sativa]BAT14384.1 Os11g0546401 [Oryza sativa Japonica Group]